MALKDIKTKIKATERIFKVTRALEAVSAAKMRKTQGSALSGRPYARAALAILARLSGSSDVGRHPLAKVRPVKNIALVVITSDKGLAGGFNAGVLKAAAAGIREKDKENVIVYAYGKKGEDYFRRRGYEIRGAFENRSDDVELSKMEALSEELSKGFLAGEYDEVVAVYSNFKSTFEQSPTMGRLLPLSIDNVRKLVNDIVPDKGKFSAPKMIESPAAYEVEPSPAEVLSILVPKLVAISLYHMLLEAKASEHSARMVAMKNASDKSKERIHEFTRAYNKIRQAAITREISEIVGGREALADS